VPAFTPRLRLRAAFTAIVAVFGVLALSAASAYAVGTMPTRIHAGPSRHILDGQYAAIEGHLTTSTGRLVKHVEVAVQGLVDGSWRTVGTAWTNADGNAIITLRPSRSTNYTFRYPGNGRLAPSRSNGVPIYVSQADPAQIAVAAAAAERGKPYLWGAAGPSAFDCSGLAEYAWARAGVALPHSALAQFEDTRHISRSALQPGDLVFVAGDGYSTDWQLIDHVGIYAGNGYWWVAPHTGTVVQLQHIYTNDLWATSP
jgi:cell wall-associated NlpC family hydrolase